MKIFLGWSGDISRQLADAFHDWLKCVIQSTEPFVSTRDIDKGVIWHNTLGEVLKDCAFGIFFLTKENRQNQWIHFEAGALSKEIGISKVCPILFDINESEISGPLASFQSARLEKEEIFKVLKSINNSLGKNALENQILIECFNTYWPRLEKRLAELKSISSVEQRQSIDTMSSDDIKIIVKDLFKKNNIYNAGLRDVFKDRLHSLESIRDEIEVEAKQIIIVGSSLKGLIGVGGDSAGNQNLLRIAIIDALKRKTKIHILLTHPEVAHHRSKQEGRETGEIEREIIENLIYFVHEQKNNPRISADLEIRLYKGTPTIFLLSSSRTMYFNPYTFYSKAFESFCFQVDADTIIYENYFQNHYLAAWNDKALSVSLKKDIKNAVIQIRQLITGPNQHKNEIIPDADIRKELELKLKELEE